MEIVLKDAIYLGTIVSGIAAYIVTSRNKTANNEQKLKEIMEAHRETVRRIEDNHKREILLLSERIDNKKKMFDEFKKIMDKEIDELKKCANKCLDNDKAEKKFATKTELKLLMNNLELQIKNFSNKLDEVVEYIKSKDK